MALYALLNVTKSKGLLNVHEVEEALETARQAFSLITRGFPV
jgi:hypothetical protein